MEPVIKDLEKLLEERLRKRGNVPEGNRFNYMIKVKVTLFDQVIIDMFVQQHGCWTTDFKHHIKQ